MCTGSLVYWYVSRYSYHSIHSQSVQIESDTHAAPLPTNLKAIHVVPRHAGPLKATPKKNKLMPREKCVRREPAERFRKRSRKPFKESPGLK